MSDGSASDPTVPRLWLRDELFEHGVVHPAAGDAKRVTQGALHSVIFELLQAAPLPPWTHGSGPVCIECVARRGSPWRQPLPGAPPHHSIHFHHSVYALLVVVARTGQCGPRPGVLLWGVGQPPSPCKPAVMKKQCFPPHLLPLCRGSRVPLPPAPSQCLPQCVHVAGHRGGPPEVGCGGRPRVSCWIGSGAPLFVDLLCLHAPYLCGTTPSPPQPPAPALADAWTSATLCRAVMASVGAQLRPPPISIDTPLPP
jgi:hypothetical protein